MQFLHGLISRVKALEGYGRTYVTRFVGFSLENEFTRCPGRGKSNRNGCSRLSERSSFAYEACLK